MKKFIYLIYAVIIVVSLVSIFHEEEESYSFSTTDAYAKESQKETTKINITHPTQSTIINNQSAASHSQSEKGALGDSLSAFEEVYGENSGDGYVASFKNDLILPIFVDGKAWSIDLQFSNSNKTIRTKEEAMVDINQLLPSDAKEVKVFTQNKKDIIEYQSDSLAGAFSKDSFEGSTPGTFIVILPKLETNSKYSSASIIVGNNP